MKVIITMKNSDCVQDAIDDAAKKAAAKIEGIDDEERETLIESKREKITESCKKFIEWGEYITIEIDTDTNSAIVVPVTR